MATVGNAFRNVHFTCDEVQLLANSLKDDKFRKLLGEFAKEINDPENRKHYEEEVKKWEKQRGVDVIFLDPSPGFALLVTGGDEASGEDSNPVCVNICTCDVIEEPSLTKAKEGTALGHNWAIPHAVTKSREENVPVEGQLPRDLRRGQVGKQNANVDFIRVIVHDVVFHPETLRLASSNDALRKSVIRTAIDALKVKDAKEIKSVNYVGNPIRSVIKKVVDKELNEQSETLNFLNKAEDERTTRCKFDNKAENQSTNVSEKADGSVKPKYSIKHVNKVDLQDFSIIPRNGTSWRAHALQVDVHLPGVSRAAQVSAEVVNQSVSIDTAGTTPKYSAEIPLPYAVNEDTSTAKFDVATQKLTLVLTVMPQSTDDMTMPMASPSSSSDSGIECEPGYRTNSDGDNSSEVSVSSQEEGLRDEGVEEEVEDDEGSVFESAPSSPIKAALVPSYTLRESENSLYLTLDCKNVLPDSVKVLTKKNQRLEVCLTTVGGGLTPLNHALVLDGSPHEIAPDGVEFTVGDEHVAVGIAKGKSGVWETVRIGKPNNLQTAKVAKIEEESNANQGKDEKSKHGLGEVSPLKQNVSEGVVRKPRVTRAVSMCEEIPTTPGMRLKGPTCSWPRGILKRRSRSLSESQLGSIVPLESLVSLESPLEVDLAEDRDGEESVEESLTSLLGEKKSVRFNDVVSRQLFRSNSSILGQRAKNQKKALKKQKCRNRRASEGSSERDSDASQCHSDPGPSSGEHTTTTTTDEDDTDATVEADEIIWDSTNAKFSSSRDLHSTFVDVDLDVENNNSSSSNANGSISNNKGSTASSENDDGEGFVVKASKKKRKNKKKNKKFEPSNNFIFQLDIEP